MRTRLAARLRGDARESDSRADEPSSLLGWIEMFSVEIFVRWRISHREFGLEKCVLVS